MNTIIGAAGQLLRPETQQNNLHIRENKKVP